MAQPNQARPACLTCLEPAAGPAQPATRASKPQPSPPKTGFRPAQPATRPSKAQPSASRTASEHRTSTGELVRSQAFSRIRTFPTLDFGVPDPSLKLGWAEAGNAKRLQLSVEHLNLLAAKPRAKALRLRGNQFHATPTGAKIWLHVACRCSNVLRAACARQAGSQRPYGNGVPATQPGK